MLSIIVASAFLPILPLLPIHILIQNLLNDFAQLGMPFDSVDNEYIKKPKTWDTNGIRKFMFSFGIISTILDILCFAVLWSVLKFNTVAKAGLFQTGWFAFGIISQTLIIHMIRTTKVPFIESTASKELLISTFLITIITIVMTFTNLSGVFMLSKLPYVYLLWICGLLVLYAIMIQILKKTYANHKKEWL